MKYPCVCCGYKTLDEKPPGTFDICPVCGWEDDNIQFEHPDLTGGANKMSLREAQKSFLEIGAVDENDLKSVRKPLEKEERDVDWKPLKS